jgi:hypothetical protein
MLSLVVLQIAPCRERLTLLLRASPVCARIGLRAGGGIEMRGQGAHGGMREQFGDRELAAEQRLQSAVDVGDVDRVAADIEEILIAPDRTRLEYVPPNPRDLRLERGSRIGRGGARLFRPRPAGESPAAVGGGSAFTSSLPLTVSGK